jgi:hypothetical protein
MSLPILNLDPKFVLELAAGLEDPDKIATRYAYQPDAWQSLKNDEHFRKVVEAKRTELQKSGYTFRLKAALAAEDLLDDVYIGAKSIDASLASKLEAFKYLTKLGGLEPKEDKQVQQGPAFTINIDLGGGITRNVTIETTDAIDTDDLPTLPAYLTALPLTNDLDASHLQTA